MPNSESSARAVDLSKLANILVVKPDEIGDFVLCTPFLRGLRMSAPDASICLVTSFVCADLARACPHIDYVITPDEGTAFRAAVQQHGFDLAVVPRFDFDRYGGGVVAHQSQAKLRFGFSESCTPLKALRNQGFDRMYYTDVLTRDPAAHEVEHNLALLEYMGGQPHGDTVELNVREDDVRLADQLLAKSTAPLPGSRILAVAPGSSYPAKELPIGTLAQIAAAAAEQIDAGIVVLGTASQAGKGAELASLLEGRAVNLCGRLALPVAAAVIEKSDAIISMCSAGGHIAAAFDRPSVVFSCHPKSGNPAHFHSPGALSSLGAARPRVGDPA
jgi:heptosyltransferase-3